MVTPYLLQIGEIGVEQAMERNCALARGVYVHKGDIVRKTIADRFGLGYKEIFSFE